MEYVQTTPVFSVVWLEHYEQKKKLLQKSHR